MNEPSKEDLFSSAALKSIRKIKLLYEAFVCLSSSACGFLNDALQGETLKVVESRLHMAGWRPNFVIR